MRPRWPLLIALLLGPALTLRAQQEPYSENIEVSLVNVEVTVTNRGKPVPNLTRDDFDVFEDGVRQEITNFHAVRGQGSVAASPSFEAATSDDERFRRKVLLLVDDTHVTKVHRNRALQSIERFINDRFTGGAYDWSIAIVGSGGAGLVLPRTSDKKAIHAALNRVRRGGSRIDDQSEAPFGREESVVQPRVNADAAEHLAAGEFADAMTARDRTMRAISVNRAIVEAVRAFAGTPGKKIVLIMTGDLGLHDHRLTSPDSATAAREVVEIRDTLIREANSSNVSLYIFNPEALAAPDGIGVGLIDGRVFFNDQHASVRGAPGTDNGFMYWIARQTGGRLLSGNRPDLSIQHFEEASSNYYSLAYRPSHPDDERYHHIEIRLENHPRYELRYREGYAAIPRQAQLVRALLTPLSPSLQTSTLAVTATLGDVQTRDGGMVVPIEAKVPLEELQFIPAAAGWRALVEIYVSIFDADGRNIALRRFVTAANAADADPEGELTHNVVVDLKSGKPHTVIVAVRDQTSDAVGLWRKSIQMQ